MKQQGSKLDARLGTGGHNRADQHETHSFLLQLPDELLALIVEMAAIHDGNQSSPQGRRMSVCDKDAVLALSRVCHRLGRMAQPVLFQNIRAVQVLPPSIRLCKLRRTFRDRPDLRRHCKSLFLDLTTASRAKRDDTWLVANEFADWLTNTKFLSIRARFDDRFDGSGGDLQREILLTLIRRIEDNFNNLVHLRLLSHSGVALSQIFERLKMQKVKTLEISDTWGPRQQDHIELEPKKRRTASFTTLRVMKFCLQPAALFLLLQWPTVLTRFDLGNIYNTLHPLDYATLETYLLVHQNSLKHIDVGHLCWGGTQRRFNAAIFPKLEFLRLSRWQIQNPLQFMPEDEHVLGPSLKTFVWDFSTRGGCRERWRDVGEPEAAWIWELAACAVSRKAALKNIEIQYEPSECPHDATEAMGYPWDRLDAIRDQLLKPNGLQLSYNKPPISKERWIELITTGSCEGGCDGTRADDAYEVMMEHAIDTMLYNEYGSGHEFSSTDEELKNPAWSYEGEDIRKYLIEIPKARR